MGLYPWFPAQVSQECLDDREGALATPKENEEKIPAGAPATPLAIEATPSQSTLDAVLSPAGSAATASTTDYRAGVDAAILRASQLVSKEPCDDVPTCCKCGGHVDVLGKGVRYMAKCKMYQCVTCGKRHVSLIKLFGSSKFDELLSAPPNEIQEFWSTLPLEWNAMRCKVTSFIIRIRKERRVNEVRGQFLPLSVYEKMGYDVAKIVKHTGKEDIEHHPILGATYRVKIRGSLEAKEDELVRKDVIDATPGAYKPYKTKAKHTPAETGETAEAAEEAEQAEAEESDEDGKKKSDGSSDSDKKKKKEKKEKKRKKEEKNLRKRRRIPGLPFLHGSPGLHGAAKGPRRGPQGCQIAPRAPQGCQIGRRGSPSPGGGFGSPGGDFPGEQEA